MSHPIFAGAMLLAGAQLPFDMQAVTAAQPTPPAVEQPAVPAAQSQPVAPAADGDAAAAPPADAASPAAPAPADATAAPAAQTSGSPPGSPDDSIVVTGRGKSAADPLQDVNVKSYQVTQKVDDAFVAPVSNAYKSALPNQVRSGLRNFLNNLREPVNFLNFMLQLKPGRAARTLGRFAINSTIGVAGLFDQAKRKPFRLAYQGNGFANTLGYYGVGPGPYFFVPLVGPTTLRDLLGNWADKLVLPSLIGKPFDRPEFVIPVFIISSLDDRIQRDDQIRTMRAQSDGYSSTRELYLKQRAAEIAALHSVKYRLKHGLFVVPNPIPAPFARPAKSTATPVAVQPAPVPAPAAAAPEPGVQPPAEAAPAPAPTPDCGTAASPCLLDEAA